MGIYDFSSFESLRRRGWNLLDGFLCSWSRGLSLGWLWLLATKHQKPNNRNDHKTNN